MKNLSAAIKGFDYKGFFLQHGEKVGIGTAGLIVLVCLGLTNWSSSFETTPQQMQETAQQKEMALKANPWPEKDKVDFAPIGHDYAVARVMTPVEFSKYSHGVPTSPKLFNYRQPADEPDILPVADLRGVAGRIPMAVYTTEADDAVAEARAKEEARKKERDAKANKSRGGGRGGGSYEEAMRAMMGRDGGGDDDRGMFMGGGATLAASKARGVRYAVVTGVVPRRKQLDAYLKALHLESIGDAPEYLNYLEFKLQRQRAVPGPNPWPDDPNSWVPVNQALGIEIFSNEVADLDPDVVGAQYISGNITSPLPHRLDGDWTFDEVGHPKIPSLDDAGRKLETAANAAAAEVVGDEADDDVPKGPTGFGKVQRDPSKLRARAQARGGSRGAGGMSAYAAAMMEAMARMQANEREDDSGGMRGGDYQAAMARAMQGMMVNDDYGGGGRGMTVVDTGADMILFRCFDFEVEPGECYRYRVQLVVQNPSYDVEYVSSSDVAAGFERTSKWSEPSPPVVVPSDRALNLAKVKSNPARRDAVDVGVVQFDPEAGTLISDTLKNLHYGEFVAAQGVMTMHFDPAVPSLKEEKVNFVTKDVLVDSAGVPPLSGAVEQDLKMTSKSIAKLLDRLEMAVTLDRFGQLTMLDADAEKGFTAAKKLFEEQNSKQEKLKASTTMSRGGPGTEDSAAYSAQRKASKRGSPLKASRRGGGDPGAFDAGGGRRGRRGG